MTRTLHLATGNAHKLREFREILEPQGFTVLGAPTGFTAAEDGTTFSDNAVRKAAALCALTGQSAVADDSGLVVDALGGAPGVHSARYAGVAGPRQDEENRRKLLTALASTPDAQRTARFVCAIAYLSPGGEAVTFEGTVEGTLVREERGAQGFGYDALFIPTGSNRTLAELDADAKHAISHRGAALALLARHLRAHERGPAL